MLLPTYQTTRSHNEEQRMKFHSHYFCRSLFVYLTTVLITLDYMRRILDDE
jgi:hypothetical protein